ncbi:MAG: hypothetical protein L6R42_008712 [Xanthoria sp. 1 TBL-2021]|nr:MAG: hypothetical protein L6R42_008712 [Xanthoria sp. 1 TBL-2021]
MKSAVILLGATVLYAVIAEILVNTVDVVLESVDISEKFLGITLFALVPNTTEFLSNYFKGSILVLTYLVIVVGFYVSGYSSDLSIMGVDRFDTLALNNQQSFKTIGRPRGGRAY